MLSDSAFAPYLLAPGALPAEGARGARQVGAGPLVIAPDQPLPAALGPLLRQLHEPHVSPRAIQRMQSKEHNFMGHGNIP